MLAPMKLRILAAVALCAFTLNASATTFGWDHDGQNVAKFELREDFPAAAAKDPTLATLENAAGREVSVELEARSYRLYVVAVNAQGLESAPSNILVLDAPPKAPLNFRVVQMPGGTARLEVETDKKRDVEIQKSPNGKQWQTAATFKNMHGRLAYEDLSGKSLFWRAK